MTSQQITNPQSVLAFDGQDDAVNLGKKPQFKIEKNLTIEAWVYVEEFKAWSAIISNFYDQSGSPVKKSGYGLLLNNASGIGLQIVFSDNTLASCSSGSDIIKLNEWHHVASIYEGQRLKFFVDGVETKVTAAFNLSIQYNPENDLQIGMYKDIDETIPFKGKIAEVRLWNIARSLDEIKKTMQYRLMGNEPGLVGYWPLNEGSGNTVSDNTANRNQGTIMGATWVQSVLPVAFCKTPELLVAEKVAADKAATDAKALADKAAAEAKAATDRALADKVAAEKETAEAKAAANKAAAEAKATADQALADKALAEKEAAQAKAAAEKDLTDKAAALAKAAQEAKAAAQAKAAADKAVAEKEAAEKETAQAQAAADKETADALATIERATASKAVAEAQATEEAQAAAEAKAAAEKAVAEKEAAEKETAQAQAAAEKSEAEAQAARAAKAIAQAKAAARKAAAEAEIAEIKAAAAKKVEKVEAEAKAAEARAKAAEAAAKAKEVEEKTTGVKPQANAPVSESDVAKAKEHLLNSTGLEDYGYWWEQMLKQPQAKGDGTVRRGRIWN